MAAEGVSAHLRPDQTDVCKVLEAAGTGDTETVFAAIRLASPAGLGEAPEHDVRHPATVAPMIAMARAAGRDSIARQWATGFADIFGPGLDAFATERARSHDRLWATVATYLYFLAALPDSHIVRKHGLDAAK